MSALESPTRINDWRMGGGLAGSYRSSQPSFPESILVAHGTPNPLIIVDELAFLGVGGRYGRSLDSLAAPSCKNIPKLHEIEWFTEIIVHTMCKANFTLPR